MNLYHIKRKDKYDYDEYSDAVVVASSEAKAKLIHPNKRLDAVYTTEWRNNRWVETKNGKVIDDDPYRDWTEPTNIEATLVGKAQPHLKEGLVICASFHAG